MYRCPNPKCRSMNDVRVRKLGYKQFVLTDNDHNEVKTSDIEPGEQYDHYTAQCWVCGKKDKIKQFKEAYAEPMDYFDTNNLCTCGGEIWNDIEIIKNSNDTKEDFVGDQRSVAMKVKSCFKCDRCDKVYSNQ